VTNFAVLRPGGWLKSGDIAYVSEQGNFVIVDRIKELIKVKGHQVALAELEALLLERPAVLDVAVDGDEAPKAFVVKQREVTEGEIQECVASRTVRYKHIAGGVAFVDEIPKNPSGKTLRRLLKGQSGDNTGAGPRL